jgi:hypothetical protein
VCERERDQGGKEGERERDIRDDDHEDFGATFYLLHLCFFPFYSESEMNMP